jgi:hypothetical protein
MITTHEAYEAAIFSMGPGFTTWRVATLTMGLPYVFVNYGEKEGRRWIYQTLILWDSNDVLHFFERLKGNSLLRIAGVSLLEPFRIGETHSLRWKDVLEIRFYDDDFAKHPVYITDAGEAVGLPPQEANRKTKLLYRVKRGFLA